MSTKGEWEREGGGSYELFLSFRKQIKVAHRGGQTGGAWGGHKKISQPGPLPINFLQHKKNYISGWQGNQYEN